MGPPTGPLHRIQSQSNTGLFLFCRISLLTNQCRGQYSDAVLSSLESQNDSEIAGITAKVKMLKDVRISRHARIRACVTVSC